MEFPSPIKPMKNIVIVIPTERESTFFVRGGMKIVHCGVGMAECAASTARLLAEGRPDLVILAGVAGTYTDDIEMGETVVVASETIADMGRYSETIDDCGACGGERFTPLFQITYDAPVVPDGFRAVRSNTVSAAGGLFALSAPVDAEIENMEGAAFFAVCAKMGVPAMEVRTISNRVGQSITGRNMEIATNRLALALDGIVNRYR